MPNYKNMFNPPNVGIGPIAPKYLEEAEREKKRKVRTYIAEQSRMKKLNEVNEQSTLTDDERQDLTAKLGGMSIGQPQPVPKFSEDSYMPSYQAQKKQPEVNTPMELPEEDQTFSLGFGRNNFGENLGLLNSDTESAKTEDYGFNLPELEKQKISSNQAREPLISTPENSRNLLYKYLEDRRKSEPDFQEAYQDRTRDAETGRVLNTFASGLGEAASMAGTLGGKRSQTGDMKALPNVIYNAQKNKADELMGLRRLSNQEQRGDIQMLRDLERGDLDNLRMQKLYKDLEGKSKVSKTLPYFVPGESGKPPKMMTLDGEGNVKAIDLPEGAKPTMESYQGLPTMYQGDTPVVGVLGTRSGEIKRTPMPGYQTMDQIEKRLREIDNEKKSAKDNRLAKLQDEELLLKKRRQKLDERKQDFDESKPPKEEKQAPQKRLSPTDIAKLSEAKNSQNIINDLNGVIDKYQDIMGPFEGSIRGSALVKPFDERAKLFDADIRRVRQVIGKLTEGGVLRKEDEAKYLEMLPNMSDTPKVAKYKAQQFGDMLKRDYENHVRMLGDQGYDTTGLTSGTSKVSQRPSLKQMSREEKLRELDEHQGAGR